MLFAGECPSQNLEGSDQVPIGSVHVLVYGSSCRLTQLSKFRFQEWSLTYSDDHGDDERNWKYVAAYGTRSAELLAAIARLEATKRLNVRVRTQIWPPPPPPATVAVGVTPAEEAATAAASAAATAPAVPPPQPPPQAHRWGPVIPADVELLELTPLLPRALWSYDEARVRGWLQKERKAMVTVLGALVPMAATGGNHLHELIREAVGDLLEEQLPGGDRERYSLISCFRELPSVTRKYDSQYDHQRIGRGDGDIISGGGTCTDTPLSSSPPPPPPLPPVAAILELPAEVLEGIMSRLGPLDLARLRATCTALADAGAAGGAVPGVRLTLFPHQRVAISWMIRRERGRNRGDAATTMTRTHGPSHAKQLPAHLSASAQKEKRPPNHHTHSPEHQQQDHHHHQPDPVATTACGPSTHPMFIQLVGGSSGGGGDRGGGDGSSRRSGGVLQLWADIGSGELHTQPPPDLPAVKGGFFCDEPGLGKTVTALSLVLKTLGQLPSPPPGAHVEWLPNREGRRVGFYNMLYGGGGGADGDNGRGVGSPEQQQELPPAAEVTAAEVTTPSGGGDGTSGGQRSARGPAAAPAFPSEATATTAITSNPPWSPRTWQQQQQQRSPPPPRPSQHQQLTPKRARGGAEKSPARNRVARGEGRGGGSGEVARWGRCSGGDAVAIPATPGQKRKRPGQSKSASSSRLKMNRCRKAVAMDDDEEEEEEEGNGGISDEEQEEEDSGGDDDGDDDDDDYAPGGRMRAGQQRRRSADGRRKTVAAATQREPGRGSQQRRHGAVSDDVAEDGRGEDEDGSERVVWVQCDQCRAWRRLPSGILAPEGDDPWFCHMHPLPEAASCTAPREEYDSDGEFANAPGFLRPGDQDTAGGGGARVPNVEYFTATLRAAAAALGVDAGRELAGMKALSWLVGQEPSALHSHGPGVVVPTEVRHISSGYDIVFRKLDLVPVDDGGGGRGGGSRRRGRGGRGGGGGSTLNSAQHRWRTAPYMARLLLDIKALAAALTVLRSRPAGPIRFYLSAATLVVLPATLIDHWLQQIRTHVARGALRVCVLDRLEPRAAPSPASLAWDYDIVITTFNRLSFGKQNHRTPVLAAAAAGGGSGGNGGWSKVLSQIHWLRVILDEGHLLGASTAITNKLQAACSLVAERRWVITGTPTPATHGSSAAHLQPLLAFLHHKPYGTHAATWQAAVQRPLDACRPEGRRRLMRLLRETMIRASKADLVLLPRLVRKVTLLDFEPQHAKSYNELVEVVRRNLLTSDWCDEAHAESLLNPGQGRWSRQMMNNVWLSCCVAGSTNNVVKEEDLLETLQLLSERLGLPPPPGLPQPVGSVSSLGPPWLAADHPLKRVEEGLRYGTDCQVCGEFVRQPMVTPCGHMACLDCTASDRERCPLPSCRTPYLMQAVDDPARKKHNKNPKWAVPQELIEWQPVYHQQNAVGKSGGTWSAMWQLTTSSKIQHIIKRLREVGAAPPPPQPPPHPAVAVAVASGLQPQEVQQQQLLLQQRQSRSSTQQPQPPQQQQHPAAPAVAVAVAAGDGGGTTAEAATITEQLPARDEAGGGDGGGGQPGPSPNLLAQDGGGKANVSRSVSGGAGSGGAGSGGSTGASGGGILSSASAPGGLVRLPARNKAIVFTMYGVHMQLIESSLMKADIPFVLLTQAIGKEKKEESLARFQHDPHCGVLVMDQLGAVGLDLSFVSYVLLMEPLEDVSLEQQVVSRAHRMGARRAVEVETLVMRGSAEEALLRLETRRRTPLTSQQLKQPRQHQQLQQRQRQDLPHGKGCTGGSGGGLSLGRPGRCDIDGGWRAEGAPRAAEDVAGAVQVDRRALRNQLFLLLEKVRLGEGRGASSSGNADGGGGVLSRLVPDGCHGEGAVAAAGGSSSTGGSGGIGLHAISAGSSVTGCRVGTPFANVIAAGSEFAYGSSSSNAWSGNGNGSSSSGLEAEGSEGVAAYGAQGCLASGPSMQPKASLVRSGSVQPPMLQAYGRPAAAVATAAGPAVDPAAASTLASATSASTVANMAAAHVDDGLMAASGPNAAVAASGSGGAGVVLTQGSVQQQAGAEEQKAPKRRRVRFAAEDGE